MFIKLTASDGKAIFIRPEQIMEIIKNVRN